MSNLFVTNIILAMTWCAVTGRFTTVSFAFGFAVASSALWLVREHFATLEYFRRFYLTLSLIGLFLYELVLASLRVARIVLTPKQNFKAGFIAVPLSCTSRAEIVLLANLITLTPGTLSVDISDDRSTLYVHALDVHDVTVFRGDVAKGFERKIMEVFR